MFYSEAFEKSENDRSFCSGSSLAVKEAEECVGDLTSLLVGCGWAPGVLLWGLPGLVCRALAEGPGVSNAVSALAYLDTGRII